MNGKQWDKASIADLELRVANNLLNDVAGYPSRNELYDSVEAMGNSDDPDIRGYVKNILYKLDRERAFSFLVRCLSDTDPDVRFCTIPFIGAYGEKATPHLIPLVQSDSSPDVRSGAAAMLGYFGTLQAIPVLKYAAEHDHELDFEESKVSSYAQHAIKQIKARYREGGNPDRYRDVVSLAEEQQIEEQENLD